MIRNLFFNIGSKVLVIGSQFLALVITNHIIGPEGRGVFLAAITWSSTFFILSHCSFSTGILNLCNKKIESIYEVAYLSTIAALVLSLISISIGILTFILYPQVFNNLNIKFLLLSFAAIPFMMLQQYAMAVVQVKGNFRAFNFLYASYSVIMLACIVVIWLLDITSLNLLININLAAWAVTGVMALYFIWPFIKQRTSTEGVFRLLIKTSLSAHLGAVVSFIVSRSDILIVNYFSTDKQTGIYGLAVGIVQMLLIIPMSVQNILYPSLLGKSVIAQKKILLQYSRITFSVMLLCSICIFIVATPLVLIVGGKNFETAIPLFKYFLPGILFYSMPIVLSTQWNIMGIFKQINAASFLVLLVSVTGNFILVPLIGVTGGGITFLTISIIAFCLQVYFVKKNLGETTIREIIFIKSEDIDFILKKNN